MKSTLQKVVLMVLFGAAIIGCNQQKSTNSESEEIEIEDKDIPAEERAEKALYDEVMDEHDEAMPKMDNMMQLKGELQEKLDLLREQEDTTGVASLETAINNLEEADEAMMQWMRDFEPQSNDSLTHDQVLEYYEQQKTLITDVHQKMVEAMKKAEDLN